MLSEDSGGENVKKSSAGWHKHLKVCRDNVEDDEDDAHHFLQYQV
jgi:hypothetical protein